jgi:membrane protein DedA with SNARE-associated domain
MNAVDTLRAVDVSSTPRPNGSLAKLWAAGTGIAVLLAASAHLLAYEVSGPLVVTGGGEVTLNNVIGFTIIGGTVGAALAYAIGRLARRPRLTFLAVTLIALSGYAVVPFTAAESGQTAIWLNIFHVVVAIPVIAALTRYLPRDRTKAEEA